MKKDLVESVLKGKRVLDRLTTGGFCEEDGFSGCNTYFKKKDENRVTYKSDRKSTQVNYVMCRNRDMKEMCNCKVMVNECVAKQHHMVVCNMVFMVKKN